MSIRVCPEVRRVHALLRALILSTLLIALVGPVLQAAQTESAAATFRGLEVRVLEDTESLGVTRPIVVLEERGREVWRAGDRVLRGAMRIEISGPADIDADGVAELHLVTWTGGAHCCLTHYFLQRDERWGVQVKAIVDQGNGEQSPLLTIAGRKRPFMLVPDNVFAYAFGACFACSPIPYVPLSFDGSRFSLASDLLAQTELLGCLMSLGHVDDAERKRLDNGWRSACRYQTAERDKQLVRISAEMRDVAARLAPEFDPDNCELCILAAEVMNPLVYAGKFAQAEEALRRAWPAGVPGRQRVSAVYWANLRQSSYWNDIQSVHFESLRKRRP